MQCKNKVTGEIFDFQTYESFSFMEDGIDPNSNAYINLRNRDDETLISFVKEGQKILTKRVAGTDHNAKKERYREGQKLVIDAKVFKKKYKVL